MLWKVTCSFEVNASDALKHWIPSGEEYAVMVLASSVKEIEKGAVQTTEGSPHGGSERGGW